MNLGRFDPLLVSVLLLTRVANGLIIGRDPLELAAGRQQQLQRLTELPREEANATRRWKRTFLLGTSKGDEGDDREDDGDEACSVVKAGRIDLFVEGLLVLCCFDAGGRDCVTLSKSEDGLELTKLLGHGDEGFAWAARSLKDGQEFAVKLACTRGSCGDGVVAVSRRPRRLQYECDMSHRAAQRAPGIAVGCLASSIAARELPFIVSPRLFVKSIDFGGMMRQAWLG